MNSTFGFLGLSAAGADPATPAAKLSVSNQRMMIVFI